MATFGTQGNIFNICQFNWYEWVYFRDVSAQFPSMKEVLGRYLGSAKNEGNEMMMWVPKANDIVVPRTGLRHITPVEQHGSIENGCCGTASPKSPPEQNGITTAERSIAKNTDHSNLL